MRLRSRPVDAQSQGGCFQARGLHIRYIDGVDPSLQQPGGGQLLAEIGTLGRSHFRCDGKFSVFNRFLQHTHDFFSLKLICLG